MGPSWRSLTVNWTVVGSYPHGVINYLHILDLVTKQRAIEFCHLTRIVS